MTGAEDGDDGSDADANTDGEDAGNEYADRLFPESEPADDPLADDAATGDAGRESTIERDGTPAVGPDDPNDFQESDAEPTVSTDAESTADAPLGDLADRMREQREGVEEDDDLFDEIDVGDVDEETLWEQVATEEAFVTEPPVDREDVVEKATYCEKCEFFTGPPRTRCTHEGTTILELADVEHFRVRNCPVVLEEEALENIND